MYTLTVTATNQFAERVLKFQKMCSTSATASASEAKRHAFKERQSSPSCLAQTFEKKES